jgi:hypothetical protein
MKFSTVVVIITFLSLLAIPLATADTIDSESLKEKLIEKAKIIQKSLPVSVDKEKTLESVEAVGDTLIFKYKVNDDSNFKSKYFPVRQYIYNLNNYLKYSNCNEKSLLNLLKAGAKLDYKFMNYLGEMVFEHSFNYENCLE